MFAQQLRQDFAGMATMFPYTFAHPLPRNQLLTSHLKKLTSDFEQNSGATEETSDRIPDDEAQKESNDNKKNEPNEIENSSSPHSEPRFSPKNDTLDKSRSSSFENLKLPNEQADGQSNEGICSDLSSVAAQWDIEEVCKFVSSVTGCSEYCDVFREQEIDGQALILLTEDHLSNKMGLKLGPALKLKSKIDELRCVYTK